MSFVAGGPGSRLGMPVSAWPHLDLKLWQAAFAEPDFFGQASFAASMAPRTRSTTETCYARWLVWVATHDAAALSLTSAARATKERVLNYLYALRDELSLRSVANYAKCLHDALRALAPGANWS